MDTVVIYSPAPGPASGITFVADADAELLLDAGQTEATTSLPTAAEDDIIVAMFVSDGIVGEAASAAASAFNVKSGQGWTVDVTDVSTSPGRIILWKRMGATPDTTIAYFPSDIRGCAFAAQTWRGVDTTTALDAATQSASGLSDQVDPPSITTATNNALVLALGGLDDDDNVTVTAPSGYTNLTYRNLATGSSAEYATVMMASKIVATAGSENPGAFAVTNGGDNWVSHTMALRPA